MVERQCKKASWSIHHALQAILEKQEKTLINNNQRSGKQARVAFCNLGKYMYARKQDRNRQSTKED